MAKTVKLGAIGTGDIWTTHSKNLALLNEDGLANQVVAICEIDETKRALAASTLGARGYASIDDMLQGEAELDGLIACTPPTVRHQVVSAAAPRRIPVFLEKPPAGNLHDATEIVRIVNEVGIPVVVGFMYRYHPAVQRLKELIGDQPINLVQSSFLCGAASHGELPGWFYLKERSGGHILDQAVHMMDLLRYVVGDITHVQTFGNNVIRPKSDDFTIEDSSATSLRFASGASGTHIHSWAHRGFIAFLTVVGRDFRLTLQLGSHSQLTGFVVDEKIDEGFSTQPAGSSHHYGAMRAFVDAIQQGEYSTLRSPYPDAAKSLAIVLAMNSSIESGEVETVKLDF